MSSGGKRRVTVNMRLNRFDLPPVESALIVGRKAPIGSRAMSKALEEMLPGIFLRVDVEHPLVEAVIVRRAHLRRVPQTTLVDLVLREAEGVIDETEMLHVALSLTIDVTHEVEV